MDGHIIGVKLTLGPGNMRVHLQALISWGFQVSRKPLGHLGFGSGIKYKWEDWQQIEDPRAQDQERGACAMRACTCNACRRYAVHGGIHASMHALHITGHCMSQTKRCTSARTWTQNESVRTASYMCLSSDQGSLRLVHYMW